MSIERAPGGFTGFDLICDECGESVYLDYDWNQFKAAVADAKEQGWGIRKTTGTNGRTSAPIAEKRNQR
ncbi:MAG: hypothetical protein ACYDH3_00060 [Candidatus Aminicenantales bacterium]